MIHPYTGNIGLDREIARKNLRAIRVALKFFLGDPELSGNLHYRNRARLRSALQTARAIRSGKLTYEGGHQ